jgi:hypothetical protein
MVEVKSNPELTLPQGVTLDVKLAFVVFVACIFFACYLEFVPFWETKGIDPSENQVSKQLKRQSTEPISLETFMPGSLEVEEP